MTEQKASATRAPATARKLLACVLIVILGLGLMLYPVVSTHWNNLAQERVAQEYEKALAVEESDQLAEHFQAAIEYNHSSARQPILDPWLARVSQDNLEYQEYLRQLSGQPAMAQMIIPVINVHLPIYHGTSEEVLQKGLGHLYGSSLPTGGEGNHTVITGHTGLTNATQFDNLINLQVGQDIYISTFGQRLKYRVYDTEIVLPNETSGLDPVAGKDLLTLITCTPYGINTHRLLVHAERVALDESDHDVYERSYLSMQWWMWMVLVLVFLALVSMVFLVRRSATARAEKEINV